MEICRRSVTEATTLKTLQRYLPDVSEADLREPNTEDLSELMNRFIDVATPTELALVMSYLFWTLQKYVFVIDDRCVACGDLSFFDQCYQNASTTGLSLSAIQSIALWCLSTSDTPAGAVPVVSYQILDELCVVNKRAALLCAHALMFYYNNTEPAYIVADKLSFNEPICFDVREEITTTAEIVDCACCSVAEVIQCVFKPLYDVLEKCKELPTVETINRLCSAGIF